MSLLDNIGNIVTEKITDIVSDKIKVYQDIINYLIDKKNNIKFDLTKSKAFIISLKDNSEKLSDTYVNLAKTFKDNNKYSDAIDLLNEGSTFITKRELDAAKLIDLKDEYQKMLPISLTTIKASESTGSAFKEELAVFDKDNNNYSKALTITKTNQKSSLSYNLNSEYKYLNATIAITKEVSEKSKNYGRIKILADNKTIYDSSDINKNFKKKEFKLDISNIKTITFEYTISNSKLSNKENVMIALIGNPTLHKY